MIQRGLKVEPNDGPGYCFCDYAITNDMLCNIAILPMPLLPIYQVTIAITGAILMNKLK